MRIIERRKLRSDAVTCCILYFTRNLSPESRKCDLGITSWGFLFKFSLQEKKALVGDLSFIIGPSAFLLDVDWKNFGVSVFHKVFKSRAVCSVSLVFLMAVLRWWACGW